MRFKKTSTKSAFTLVELLIVVGIIGLLATIGVSAYQSAAMNSRNQQRKANLTQLQKALELYANDHGGTYPNTFNAWYGEPASRGSKTTSGSNGYIPNLAPEYIGVLPHDQYTNALNPNSPDSGCRTNAPNDYACYLYRSNGVDYKILAFCLPEGTTSSSDPFYDPLRATRAWQVSTPGGLNW